MKRFLTFIFFTMLFAASCGENDPVSGGGGDLIAPQVVTATVSEYGATTAVLGGEAVEIVLSALTQVGVQYVEWESGAAGTPPWDAAMTRSASEPALSWSLTVEELTPGMGYVVRAFARTADAEYFGKEVIFTTDSKEATPPVVTTADVTDFDATTAVLGGSVSGVEVSALTGAGVQYIVWTDALQIDGLDWTKAVDCAAAPAASWSVRASNLNAETQYGVRAYVRVGDRRYFGDVKSFTTNSAGRSPLTVAQLRVKYAASADVAEESVRGYVALSVPQDCSTESFAAGSVILYDNTGVAASAMMLCGDAANGIGTAGLREGDYVEVALAGAERNAGQADPCYTGVAATSVQVLGRDQKIEPVWATPAQLVSQTSAYSCSPVKLSRVYAQTPGVLFSVADNWFTDGTDRVAVYAKAGSVVGQLKQNSATGTLCGICMFDGSALVIPVKASDVAAFTGDDGITEGTPKIELVKGFYEFAPQGGTLVVNCKVTRTANLRLFADTRFFDTERYAIDIEGERVTVTARPNMTGVTADYTNFYLYLAETKDGPRTSPVTVKVTQLSSQYESIPSLIQANSGELSSVHETVANGYATSGMKLGSGNYTGHYTSDPLSAPGAHKLVFYAVGWKEGDHAAGTLYLRVENGGSASVGSIPLKVNDGATGQAPFRITAGSESRYEVALTGLTIDSSISFSTSPSFDKKKDDKTGRALLFGMQLVD